MQTTGESRTKGFFRSSPSTAFDQYLQDIQKLPLITDAEEERRLARRAQAGDEKAAERLVTNLRFVISLRQSIRATDSILVTRGDWQQASPKQSESSSGSGCQFISYAVVG
jgi:RNA polymerase primary sigma factor